MIIYHVSVLFLALSELCSLLRLIVAIYLMLTSKVPGENTRFAQIYQRGASSMEDSHFRRPDLNITLRYSGREAFASYSSAPQTMGRTMVIDDVSSHETHSSSVTQC